MKGMAWELSWDPLTARWSQNLSSGVDVEKSSLGSRDYVKDLALHLLL